MNSATSIHLLPPFIHLQIPMKPGNVHFTSNQVDWPGRGAQRILCCLLQVVAAITFADLMKRYRGLVFDEGRGQASSKAWQALIEQTRQRAEVLFHRIKPLECAGR